MKMLTDNLIRPRRTRYTLHSSRFTFLDRLRRTRKTPFMQNEPNFKKPRSKLSAVIAATYNEITLVNQKITNPFEANPKPT